MVETINPSELQVMTSGQIVRIGEIIWREVEVNRDESPEEAIDATGCVQYTNPEVVKTMPRGKGKKVRVGFFKLDLSKRGGYISDDDLQKEYDLRNMESDPYAQMAVNKADPAFTDTNPNGSHWKCPDGKWCYVLFRRWHDGRRLVHVNRSGGGWHDFWSFAGVSK